MSKIEGLESRQYFAGTLRVGSVQADNRGEVVVRFSEKTTGVKGSAFQLYTAGTDGKLFTSDDKRETVGYSYSENKKQLTIRGHLAKDTPYRIKLDGKTRIKSQANGSLLDGDFNGTLASGDGTAGGNFEAQFSRDKSGKQIVRMPSSVGDLTIRLRGDVAPKNAANFLSYANTGRFDNIFFTRGISGFVDQVGSLQITGDGQQADDIIVTQTDAPLADEARVLSNTRGTLSFAKSGPNSITNQFFFNLGNNSSSGSNNLDEPTQTNSTFFTPFAEVVDQTTFNIIDQIGAATAVNLSAQIGSTPGTGTDSVPARDPAGAQSAVVPAEDLFVIYRVAPLMLIAKK
jgi:cyclophilin family peptidyl-prolyl cis-trans isomerase